MPLDISLVSAKRLVNDTRISPGEGGLIRCVTVRGTGVVAKALRASAGSGIMVAAGAGWPLLFARTTSTREISTVKWKIEFTGSGLAKPMAFTYEQLSGMEMTRLEKVRQQMTHFPDKIESWEGVALEPLLERAQPRSGSLKFTLVAADGYTIECSGAQLKSAIIALKDGHGSWLAEVGRRRPVKLVAPNATGDYWVRNLVQINVEPVPDSGSS